MFDVTRIAAVALALIAVARPVASAEACIADWAVAAPILTREKLVTMEQLSPLVRARGTGEILKSSLCDDKGRFYFRLVVRDPNGKVTNIIVDARRPFER